MVLGFCYRVQQTRQVVQLCAQQSEDREEPARWLRPPCFLTGSIATVSLIGALISTVCSEFSESHGWHEQGEERELLMVPAWIMQANKEPETDNQNQRTHEWFSRPFPLYHTRLSLLGSTTVACRHHQHRPPLTLDPLTCVICGVEFNSWIKLEKGDEHGRR